MIKTLAKVIRGVIEKFILWTVLGNIWIEKKKEKFFVKTLTNIECLEGLIGGALKMVIRLFCTEH